MEVVGVEVLVSRRCSKEKVEKFENEQLERSFALAVQKEDYVLAECFVSGALG